MINFELKVHQNYLLFTLFYILYNFQLCGNSWEASEHQTLRKIWLRYLSSTGYLSTYKKSMWSSHSCQDMCDQRILQSRWLKWGHFWPYFVIFAQREFFLKNPAKYNNKCQRYRVDWPSIQKLFHHYVKIVHSIC